MNILATFRPLITAACLLALSAPAMAQVSAGPRAGDWVRIETLGKSSRLQGRLMRLDTDSLVLARGDSATNRVAVARADVTNVWVSIGRKRQTWRGLGIGLGLGAGVGAIIAGVSYEECVPQSFMDCFLTPESAGQAALLGGTVGGVFGMLLGGAAGFATKRHVWEPIGIPTSIGLSPAGHSRVAVALRISI